MKAKLFTVSLLLAANIVVPRILSAQACCKYCGQGTQIAETTRTSSSCLFYCTVVTCSTYYGVGSNCKDGTNPCSDAYTDNCDSYVPCGTT